MTVPQDRRVEHLLRELAPQVLGAVARRHKDFGAAEDAVQEALLAAALQWPAAGIPDNPRGWLFRVAVRRLADEVRSEAARRRREAVAASEAGVDAPFVDLAEDEAASMEDDTLPLLFMCCHPALTSSSAIALTLRAVGGLTTAEIARAFLVPEATMAHRISRSKQTIKASGVPFSGAGETAKGEQLKAVLHVLYLIFNEGYSSGSGPVLNRTDLANEAIRLTRAVHALVPDDAEVTGLLALMLLTDARRAARVGPVGELIPLDEQDRTLWDRELITEGIALITEALSRGAIGSYQLQAAIAAIHDEAPSTAATDWAQIRLLYGMLMRMSDNPMVVLNHAIATAMVDGPSEGLRLLGPLDSDPRLAGHYRLAAARAHLYEMLGDHARAVAAYRSAADLTASIPERDYLIARAARLRARADSTR